MDILIAAALLVIAICVVFGKGFKININHTYEPISKSNKIEDPTTQENLDDEFKAMTDVVKSIQDFMGVNEDE